MDTVSYGEERPKATNETAEGRALNRRASLVVKIQ
jgi:outer membrane protein OmpA-like peptidoglycan-associated protein